MSKRSFGRAGWLLALTCLVHAAAPTAARAQDTAGWADQILTLVNQQRAAAGLNPLSLNSELSAAATSYSQYMATADFFAHDGPDGSTPQSRQVAAGYTNAVVWGENIAAGQPDPQSVMTAWMNSPGHRANILFRGFTEIGIGVYSAPGTRYGTYWTQEFGARAEGAGVPTTTFQPPPSVPSLAAINPAQGAAGDVVTLSGSRFGSSAGSVSFAGVQGTLVAWSDTQIQVRVPAGASSGSVYVMAANGLSNGLGFTVAAAAAPPPAAPPPTVPTEPTGTGASAGTGVSLTPPPTSAAPVVTFFYPATVQPGTRVTLYGHSFGQTAGAVLLNGVSVPVAYWYDTIIGITVPNGASTGTLQVQAAGGSVAAGTLTVVGSNRTPTPAPAPAPTPAPTSTTPAGTGAGAGTRTPTPVPTPQPTPTPRFVPAPTPPARPVIDSVTPASATPGAVVTLNGHGFGTQTGWVRFGRYRLQVVSWSDTAISVQLPSGWHGLIRVIVVRPDFHYSNYARLRF